MVTVTYDPADQRKRRRRSKLRLADMATALGIGITSVSDYERGKKSLPFELTGEDYERALLDLIGTKRAR